MAGENEVESQMIPLSEATILRLQLLFHSEHQSEATRLLENFLSGSIPFHINPNPASLERIRFAALKISGGDITQLKTAIDLAHQDWRDLLMAAGFEEDVNAHENWWPKR